MFGKESNIEQGYETAGLVTKPQNNGAGINLTYANMSFGQGILVTPLQMAAAVSSILNGGTLLSALSVGRQHRAERPDRHHQAQAPETRCRLTTGEPVDDITDGVRRR